MDFVRLGERYTSTYVPDKLIEGYNSLIFTERHQAPGEFELKSYDIENLIALLPEDTLVSHLETQETMMVETHEINMVGEGADAVPELTIKGRSASTILEHRWVEANYGKKRRMRKKYSATSALAVLMVNAIDNASGKDLTRGDTDPDTAAELNDYPWTTKDVIPNVAITETVSTEGAARWWSLQEGMLYPQYQKILVDADLCLRCLRPVPGNAGTVVTVKSALADRGDVVRTANGNINALRFDVYQGLDRSGTVQFSLLQGHLDKPTYLTSYKDYKSVVEVRSDHATVSDVYRSGEGGLTGWQRRTMEFDAGSPELPPEPQKPAELKSNATAAQKRARATAMDKWQEAWAKWDNKRDRIVADFREEKTLEARRLLKQQRKLNMFAGDISLLSPYVFKTHYDLGDTVKLFGDYGKSAKMVVAEYVRTEDASGDRGFPGLIEP